jgi:hypothetical protein
MESNISNIQNDAQIQILNKTKTIYGGFTHDTKYNC